MIMKLQLCALALLSCAAVVFGVPKLRHGPSKCPVPNKADIELRLQQFKQELHPNQLLGKNVDCKTCDAGVKILEVLFSLHATDDCIAYALSYLCVLFDIEDASVCHYATGEWEQSVIYIIRQLFINPQQVCPRLVKDCGSEEYDHMRNWTFNYLNTTKPPVEPYQLPPEGSPTLKVLHFSDIHYDLAYNPGSEAKCPEPLCCRSKVYGNETMPAGKWGTVALCDTPYWTFESILQQIKDKDDFEYGIFTGDLPPHNVWEQTRDFNTFFQQNLTRTLKKYFPNKKFYNAVGNHGAAPVNMYTPTGVPDNLDIKWLYSALNISWTALTGDKSITHDVMQSGSYVTKVAPGLRILSLNTNYHDGDNFYLYLERSDEKMGGVLAFAQQALQDAEDAGDKVHILGHETPGGYKWGNVYYNLINRYESTIRAQFFGHTHSDEFTNWYDNGAVNDTGRVTSTSYTQGSITTYSYGFPAYRVYTIDGRTQGPYAVLDWRNMYMNLTKVNAQPPDQQPTMEIEYSARDAYNMNSCFPADMDDLAARMRKPGNEDLIMKYVQYNHGSAPWSCDAACIKGYQSSDSFRHHIDPPPKK